MTTMICVASVTWTAWLIPHLIANNSASVLDGVMNCFGYSIATEVDMQYRGNNIIFDASV